MLNANLFPPVFLDCVTVVSTTARFVVVAYKRGKLPVECNSVVKREKTARIASRKWVGEWKI